MLARLAAPENKRRQAFTSYFRIRPGVRRSLPARWERRCYLHGETEQHMQEDPQVAEHRKRLGLPPGIDPRNFDPRKAVDPAVVEKMVRAQVVARLQATQATTVFLATVVSLITSAFGFVAALAWNQAIQDLIGKYISIQGGKVRVELIYAVIVTFIGVVVIVVLNRIGRRLAKHSVIGANGD